MKRKPADILAGTTEIFEQRSKQLTLERTIAERYVFADMNILTTITFR
jgi:hypothetical protein